MQSCFSFPSLVPWVLVVTSLVFATAVEAGTTTVRFNTTLGSFDVELYDDLAPTTVANFLSYVETDGFRDSIVHRSVPNFVIQGGGFNSGLEPMAENSPIPLELAPGQSNLRGRIAMARISGNTQSATRQWFINLVDNPFLDKQGGGYAVFGNVIGDGMAIVDAIAKLPHHPVDLPNFGELPMLEVPGANTKPSPESTVRITSIVVVPEPTGIGMIGLPFIFALRISNHARKRSPRTVRRAN